MRLKRKLRIRITISRNAILGVLSAVLATGLLCLGVWLVCEYCIFTRKDMWGWPSMSTERSKEYKVFLWNYQVDSTICYGSSPARIREAFAERKYWYVDKHSDRHDIMYKASTVVAVLDMDEEVTDMKYYWDYGCPTNLSSDNPAFFYVNASLPPDTVRLKFFRGTGPEEQLYQEVYLVRRFKKVHVRKEYETHYKTAGGARLYDDLTILEFDAYEN